MNLQATNTLLLQKGLKGEVHPNFNFFCVGLHQLGEHFSLNNPYPIVHYGLVIQVLPKLGGPKVFVFPKLGGSL